MDKFPRDVQCALQIAGLLHKKHTSNQVESLWSLLKEVREIEDPAAALVRFVEMSEEKIDKYAAEASSMSTFATTKAIGKLAEVEVAARDQVTRIAWSGGGGGRRAPCSRHIFHVNIHHDCPTCDCGGPQVNEFPRIHVAAVINECAGKTLQECVSCLDTTALMKSQYLAAGQLPVLDFGSVVPAETALTKPLAVRRPRGRPKMKRGRNDAVKAAAKRMRAERNHQRMDDSGDDEPHRHLRQTAARAAHASAEAFRQLPGNNAVL